MLLRMRRIGSTCSSGSSGLRQGCDNSRCRVLSSRLSGHRRAFVAPLTHSRRLQSLKTATPPSTAAAAVSSICPTTATTTTTSSSSTKGLPLLLPYHNDKPHSAVPRIALSSSTRVRFYSHQSAAASPPPPPTSVPLPTMAYEGKWTAQVVRKTFLSYFEERGHQIVPSGSVVPHNDPTLLFTNAGMNQFKPIFLGTVNKSDPMASLKRATDTQKCIRAGGKHNDLDDVGKDSYHHTFFEMLGNWSFGDYFKKEAITYSWELLTKVYGLDPSRLYVTYFEGNADMGLEPDLEARDLWKSVGVAEDHILPGNMKDNFWEMGDQGPCGPCSEVHYDKVGGRNAAHLVNEDDPLVVEIWNNVFIQFDRQQDRSLKSLPAKHVDTGMGYERLVSALQDKISNYATDVFTPLFARIQEVAGARPYTDKYGKDDADGIDTAYRVVADHIRLLTFSMADGAVPNNEGRGYVVRRVLRRGSRYARKYFNAEIGSFFSKILPALVAQQGEQFPEIVKKQKDIAEILDEEEEAFAKTLDRGEKQFEKFVADLEKKGEKKLSGLQVWRLYDTYGFPEDLTKLMSEERGLEPTDESDIAKAREEAREASKKVKDKAQAFPKLNVHQIAELENEHKIPRPDSEPKYGKGDITSNVQMIFTGDQFVKTSKDIPTETPLGLILDKTNFYAESGGQVADTGRILVDDDVAEFKVEDVQEYGGYIVHIGYFNHGSLTAGDKVICEYEELRRQPIRNNHTGTHILNHSLREVLGDEVNQKGSLVDEDKLRFDFSHKTGVTTDELKKIEDLSNAYIAQNSQIYYKDVDLASAKQIEGVRAVFGETYPDPVRVVSVGIDVDMLLENPKNPEWRKVSVEFCGGTHVDTTGIIKDLVVVEESGIAKGIRRVVAYTGDAAHEVQRLAKNFGGKLVELEKLPFGPEKEEQAKRLGVELGELRISVIEKEQLKTQYSKIQKSVMDEQKKRQKAESKTALDTVTGYFGKEENKTSNVFVGALPISANMKAVSDVMAHFKSKDKAKSVYVFGGSKDAGVVHAVYVGTDLASKGISAEKWATTVAEVIGGKAGGKDPTRQGSGTKPEKLDEAVQVAEKWLEEEMKKLKI